MPAPALQVISGPSPSYPNNTVLAHAADSYEGILCILVSLKNLRHKYMSSSAPRKIKKFVTCCHMYMTAFGKLFTSNLQTFLGL